MITGNEAAFARPSTGHLDSFVEGSQGLSIRQLALKDFMCAIISNNNWDTEDVVKKAQQYTNQYIEQLNK